MINRAFLIGRVGQAPKNFGKGLSFSVATDSGFGERKTTIWENVTVFGKQAESLSSRLTKGMLVYVQGRREQTVKGDVKYSNVVADEVKFLEKAGDKQTREAASPADLDDSDIPL